MLRIARWVYFAFAWLFVVGIVTQVFLAGMVVVARRARRGSNGAGDQLLFKSLAACRADMCATIRRFLTSSAISRAVH